MTDTPDTIDACEALLKSQSWSVGDFSFVEHGKQQWAMQCSRGQNTRFGYGETQLAAWQQAVERCSAKE
jgi:hypothetical protein